MYGLYAKSVVNIFQNPFISICVNIYIYKLFILADHEMTTTALKFEKAMKQQLSDMEACGECYREKCVKYPQVDFFSKVCVSVVD